MFTNNKGNNDDEYVRQKLNIQHNSRISEISKI